MIRVGIDDHQANTLRHGLTLLEMVIVLAILAALTGIAVKSLEPVADQARYDATKQTLENVRDSIQSRDLTNGTVDYSGFVSDMGRLPVAVNTGDELHPVELWRSDLTTFGGTADLVGYQLQNDFADPYIDSTIGRTVPVASGWRGPYVQLAPGAETLRDGYGRPMVLIADDTTPTPTLASEGDAVVNFGSLGANTGDASDDLVLPNGVFGSGRIEGTLSATVRDSNGDPVSLTGTERLFVRVYGPATNLGGPGVLANAELPTGVGVLNNHDATPEPYRITCGIRTVRAVVVTGVTDVEPPPSPATETVESQSSARQIVVKPGANVLPTLYLDRP